jgi:hypothetical protein
LLDSIPASMVLPYIHTLSVTSSTEGGTQGTPSKTAGPQLTWTGMPIKKSMQAAIGFITADTNNNMPAHTHTNKPRPTRNVKAGRGSPPRPPHEKTPKTAHTHTNKPRPNRNVKAGQGSPPRPPHEKRGTRRSSHRSEH